ncbi:hypothetical protein [Streptomyces sp. NBC_01320]|uniref:hypothetical protein n=1 Tax=Streptomyces sp. NBC_01320 TaxID=2903824 RepID=UPI002E15649F|nr:hypothetical protein OG395_47525 [Streptomyces sp. NBC_01320]
MRIGTTLTRGCPKKDEHDADGTVGCRQGLMEKQSAERFDVVLLAREWAVAVRRPGNGEPADQPLLDSPAEKVVRVSARAGAVAEPGIDVMLTALVQAPSAVAEPAQELDGDGRVLLGTQEGAGGHGSLGASC